jgi:hypothetical protein
MYQSRRVADWHPRSDISKINAAEFIPQLNDII